MLSEKRMDSWEQKVEELAKVYGPFVRFYHDGNEDDDTLNKVIKDGDDNELKNNAEFEKTRQRADQEAANALKARTELQQTQSALGTMNSENEQLKEKLAEAEAKAAESGIDAVELEEEDYEGTDLALVKSIKALTQKIEAKDARIAGLEKKATDFEQQIQQDNAANARNTAYEELLSDLDEEYGADCRNEAIAKFNELGTKGKIPQGNPAKATRLIEKCYKEAKAALGKAKNDKKKPSLSLDTGSGGGSAPNLSGVEIKDGQSLDEAVEQIGAIKTLS